MLLFRTEQAALKGEEMIKRVLGLLMTIGLFLLASGFQQSANRDSAQSWIELQSKEGAFSILMPHQPARQSDSTKTAAGSIDMVMFTVSTDSAFYAIIYSDFPFVPSTTDEINKRLDNGRDGGLARSKGRLVSETRITLDGYLGREIKAKLDEGFLVARIFSVKQRLYQMLMAGTEADVSSANATRFFNSFKLTADEQTANQPDWLEFAVPEGGFTILMPGKPEKEIIPVTIPGEETSMYFYSFTSPEGTAFIASYSDMNLDVASEDKVKMFLDGVREGQVKSNKANKLIAEKSITLAGYPGREFTIKTPAGITISRVYLVGNRVYQLFFVKPAGYQDGEKSGQRFLDSFKLTKGK